MRLEQRPPAAVAFTQIRPLLAIVATDDLSNSQVLLGVGAAMAELAVPPAVGVFRPPADWAGIFWGGVCESAESLWYCGCNHIDSPMNRLPQGSQPPWDPYFSQILTNTWEAAKAPPRLRSTA